MSERMRTWCYGATIHYRCTGACRRSLSMASCPLMSPWPDPASLRKHLLGALMRSESAPRKPLLCVALCIASIGLSLGQTPPSGSPATVTAIVHGRLLTVTHGAIENGTLLMAGGRITAVGGPETPLPADALKIDATGL